MLVEAKSNLARLMATENLVIEERNVPTAFFDIKSRILTVPILNGNLSPYLYDLLLGHEVGHALETPADGWHDSVIEHKVNKSILNVCEDVRIEKKIKRRFPGLKPSFIRGYTELMEMDFFGTKDMDLNELNFIDRVNLYTKGGPTQGILFSSEETVLLREIESTETWEEVVAVSRKVQEFMKAELDKAEEEQKVKIKIKIKGEKGEPLTEEELKSIEDADVEFEIDDSEDDSAGQTVNIDIDAKGKEGVAKGESEKEGGKLGGSGASNKGTSGDVDSETDKAFREREKQLYDTQNKRDVIYSNIPKLFINKIVISHKEVLAEYKQVNLKQTYEGYYKPAVLRKNFIQYKNESNKVVSYLVKEFELRKNASQQSRAKISKTGDLNMNKIHEYKITDDIFARMTKIPNGKSHGLVMYIDWSGSMQDKIHATIKQLLNLVMFCKKVNIPFDVYAFTTQWSEDDDLYNRKIQNPVVGDIKVETGFHLLNLFNHKMTAIEYTEMASFLLDFKTGNATNSAVIPHRMRLGGTPLNQTIVAAFEMIPEFKKKNKIDIVNAVFLTDGESGSLGERYSFYDTTNRMRNNTIVPDGRNRQIFRDPITKATAEPRYAHGYGGAAAEATMALLKLLKQRANCNLMGFYVTNAREARSAFELYQDIPETNGYTEKKYKIDKLMDVFRKERVYVMENVGYDEYYIVGSNSLETDDDELKITSTTTRSLVSAFSKYTGGKVNSRIILNRFIKMIA